MNRIRTAVCLLLSFVAIFCRNTEQKQTAFSLNPQPHPKTFVQSVGQIGFRRSYADIQFMSDESDIDRYLEKQSKSNPVLMEPIQDSALFGKLQLFGLVRGNELLIKRFEPLSKKGLVIMNTDSLPIYIGVKKHNSMFDQTLFFARRSDSLFLKMDFSEELHLRVLKGALDKDKTVVIVNEYYLMNGHNFDVFVYETRDK